MSTTNHFQKHPDYYDSQEECIKNAKLETQTNPRYSNFKQTHFTAGDEEQFEEYRDATNGNVCVEQVSLQHNMFEQSDNSVELWRKFQNLNALAVSNTFRYIFHKFKKGVFVKIQNNELKVFLPFSKAKYRNEWSQQIKIDPSKYGDINDFLKRITLQTGYKFNPKNVSQNIEDWYANNCLVRYEYPISEGESTVNLIKTMFEELCKHRQVPDIEFFYNRRDFPLMTVDETEPYNNIWGTAHKPLISHNYDKYSPLLSMSSTPRYADVLMPTWEDWARIQSLDGKYYPRSCRDYNFTFENDWDAKKPTAIFRGSTTGCGVTVDDNMRLRAAYISHETQPDENGVPYLDAGISKWNLRPRKLENSNFLETIDIDSLPFGLASFVSPKEQSAYKYILNIDGHVTAYRLSLELNMGSVVLKVDSPWKVWYSDLLVPYKHYVPVKHDLSDLIDQIKWCRDNDSKCKQIASNAKEFYNRYLLKDGALDFLQKTLVELKSKMGVYLYNTRSLLSYQSEYQTSKMPMSFPEISLNVFSEFPLVSRVYGDLKGIEWVVKKMIADDNLVANCIHKQEIFRNKLSTVSLYDLGSQKIVIKSTSDPKKTHENINDAFIGMSVINNLAKLIPNFMYTYGTYTDGDTNNMVVEYIGTNQGSISFLDYLSGPEFKFESYLFLMIQICLALKTAQDNCAFVHYDLTPWNIMLLKLSSPQVFEYILDGGRVVNIKTSMVPVIIDYGKSHAVVDDIHVGVVKMFNTSKIQDVISLLVTSVDVILKKQKVPASDFRNMVGLMNFLSGTAYYPGTFHSAKDMRNFCKYAHRYSELLGSDKGTLYNNSPISLFSHILKMNEYKFKVNVNNVEYRGIMNRGNSLQVFEYSFNDSTEGRSASYSRVFDRVTSCYLPIMNNRLMNYMILQELYHNIESVWGSFVRFLSANGIDPSLYESNYQDTVKCLKSIYDKTQKLGTLDESQVLYSGSNLTNKVCQPAYTESTFLLPERIRELLDLENCTQIDYSNYKLTIIQILRWGGEFKLSDEERMYYLGEFKLLINSNSLGMKLNIANCKTLGFYSEWVYKEDVENLQLELDTSDGNCKDAMGYLGIYNDICAKV